MSKPKYFDIHSHLQSKKFKEDIDKVIFRLKETNTDTIVVGTDLESSQEAVTLALKNEGIYACIGVHPVDNPTKNFDKDLFEKLLDSNKVVAIGECGLDFYKVNKEEDYERQKKLFLDQVDFAVKKDLPLMIHARDAYLEILDIISSLKPIHGEKLRGNVHFFAGNREIAQKFFALNFSISFTGVITFTNDYDDVIKNSPIDMIMAETDSPYVSPAPYRGERCEPAYVSLVYDRIAQIRGEDPEYIRSELVKNALRMVV